MISYDSFLNESHFSTPTFFEVVSPHDSSVAKYIPSGKCVKSIDVISEIISVTKTTSSKASYKINLPSGALIENNPLPGLGVTERKCKYSSLNKPIRSTGRSGGMQGRKT